MRTISTELIDLILTQAIERYSEMTSDEAYEAIASEWPEQTAALLEEFLFKTTCGNFTGMTDLIQIERDNGFGFYFSPICTCEWDEWRQP
jgi:hypothetical protein